MMDEKYGTKSRFNVNVTDWLKNSKEFSNLNQYQLKRFY